MQFHSNLHASRLAVLFSCLTEESWLQSMVFEQKWYNQYDALHSSLCDFQHRTPLCSCCLLQDKIKWEWVNPMLRSYSTLFLERPGTHYGKKSSTLPSLSARTQHTLPGVAEVSCDKNWFWRLDRLALFFAC